MNRPSERQSWESHWDATCQPASLFGRVASVVRRQLLSRAVHHYSERYFERRGVFVECGCGTAQSSGQVPALDRILVALDFSGSALAQARLVSNFGGLVQADIRQMPFVDGSVSGIWNLGVMEHFEAPAGLEILREFRRVLHPRGVAILFWPPTFGASRLLLAPIEWLRSRRGRQFRFFPDEVNLLRSKRHAREVLCEAGLEAAAVDFAPRAGFIHMIVVARKPSA